MVLQQIEAELSRLRADVGADGICVARDAGLPTHWVRVYDGHAEAYGPGGAILDALKAVEYDPAATVEEEEPYECVDPDCPVWSGEQPSPKSRLAHGHSITNNIPRDNGWELAWQALQGFADDPPEAE